MKNRILLQLIYSLASFTAPLIVSMLICAEPSYGANTQELEKSIVTLANEAKKDLSYQDHQKLIDKVSTETVGSINDPDVLANIAIWANFNTYSNEFDEGYINYNHIVRTARSSAIAKLGDLATPAAEAALWRVAHQVNIDGHLSEEMCDAMTKIRKKPFLFGERIYVHFLDPIFEKQPLKPEIASFRIKLCEEIWSKWKAPTIKHAGVIAKATFIIDGDRQITNVKVLPMYFGKEKNAANAQQFTDAARSTLEKCTIQDHFPEGVKKVKMAVDFYGQ